MNKLEDIPRRLMRIEFYRNINYRELNGLVSTVHLNDNLYELFKNEKDNSNLL